MRIKSQRHLIIFLASSILIGIACLIIILYFSKGLDISVIAITTVISAFLVGISFLFIIWAGKGRRK